MSNLNRVKSFLRKKGQFRYNLLRGAVELRSESSGRFEPLKEYDFNTLRFEIKEDGIDISTSDLIGLLQSNFSQPYDPIQQYFDELPAWDPSQADYIKLLANTVRVEDQDLWERMLKVWLVAVVACALGTNPNELVLILVGTQGKGKTKWLLRLIPERLWDYCNSGKIDFRDKDAAIDLSQCFLIIMDEMANFSRRNFAELKEWISKPFINIRRPYARFSENMRRRGSFSGATNESRFLFDDTGSRRYLAFEPTLIDYLHDVPMDMVFAQAKQLWKDGFPPYLSDEEIKEIQYHNQKFEEISEEEELVAKHFQKSEIGCGEFLLPTEILRRIEINESIAPGKLKATTIGRALRKFGFNRIKQRDRWGYLATMTTGSLACDDSGKTRSFKGASAKDVVRKMFGGEG